MKIYVLLICMIHRTPANVEWRLKESLIKIGEPINLECTASNAMQNVSRRWTGGVKNRLLCFNGVTTNPQKYTETKETARKYILQIKETTEDDLDCPYSCRFGFQSDEKILYVTEDNFNYLPDENTTEIEYSRNKENYTLHLEFKKVFPEPVCKIQIKDTVRNLTKVKGSKGRIFYHTTYQMESRESLHACGSDVKIKCTIGQQLHDINFSNDLKCTALDEIKSTISDKLIAGIVLGLFATVVICFLAYFTYSKKKKSEKRDQGKTYKTANTTNENCHPELQTESKTQTDFNHSCQTDPDLDVVGRLSTNRGPASYQVK